MSALLSPGDTESGIVSEVRRTVLDRPVPARLAVVEEQYVDRDYLAAYAHFYSRAFRDYPRYCKRIHFFSYPDPLTPSDLMPRIDPDEDLKFNKLLQAHYIGFCVLRPTYPLTIGRTVLSPPYPNDGTAFVLATRSHSVNLLGYQLYATGSPFIEQDARSAVCASAAMWMAHSSVGQRLDLPMIPMSDLTGLAGSWRHELDGLTIGEISRALSSIGYRSVTFEAISFPRVKDAIYTYIESGLPVILSVLGTLRGARWDASHAIVVLGHKYVGNPFVEARSYQSPLYGEMEFYDASDWTPAFIVHDDQRGPYLELDILPFASLNRSTKNKVRPALPNGVTNTDIVPVARWANEVAVIDNLVVGLPPQTFLLGDEAQEKARRILQRLHVAYGRPFSRVALRTYLIESNEFKKAVLRRAVKVPELAKLYRAKNMSRFVWVTEVTKVLYRGGTKPHINPLESEILLDYTSSSLTDDFVAGFAVGRYFEMGVEELDPAGALAAGTVVNRDADYYAFVRDVEGNPTSA